MARSQEGTDLPNFLIWAPCGEQKPFLFLTWLFNWGTSAIGTTDWQGKRQKTESTNAERSQSALSCFITKKGANCFLVPIVLPPEV